MHLFIVALVLGIGGILYAVCADFLFPRLSNWLQQQKREQDQINYFRENLIQGCAIEDIIREWESSNGKLSDDDLADIEWIEEDVKWIETQKRKKQERDEQFQKRLEKKRQARKAWDDTQMIPCKGCNKELHKSATSCPHCGATGKSKILAACLALSLGGIGIHRFYLGQWWGLFYTLFCWTFIPLIVALIEGIIFFIRSDYEWNVEYGFLSPQSKIESKAISRSS